MCKKLRCLLFSAPKILYTCYMDPLEYSICQSQPWVCMSLPRILVTEYALTGVIFVLLCAFTALLAVIAIPFLKRKRRKYHPLIAFKLIFLFLLFSPLAMLQLTLAQKGVKLTSNTVKCIMLSAPNQCYTFAAITAASVDKLAQLNFDNSFAICDLTPESAKCKVQVCDYLQVESITTSEVERLSLKGEDAASRSARLSTVQQQCWEEIAPTCPNGNILDNIPCGCYSPELGRFAVHTEFWLTEYWEKYRKMDPKPYCCDGEKSPYSCT